MIYLPRERYDVPLGVLSALPYNVDRNLIENLQYGLTEGDNSILFWDKRNGSIVAQIPKEKIEDLEFDVWDYVLKLLAHKREPKAADVLRNALEECGAL